MVLSGLTFQRVVLRTVFTLTFLVFLAPLRAQPDGIAGTMPEDYLPELKQILATALQRSPDTVAREFDRQAAEARLDIARSSRLPQLGGSFNYGISEASASDASSKTRDSGFFYSLGLNQQIFHWGALKNQHDIARIDLLLQNRNFAQAYRDLCVMIRKAYLALVVEKARLNQNRAALALLRSDLAITKAKKEAGVASAAALAGDELRVRENELDLNRGETEFATNRRRFARLAGLPELPEEKIPNEIPVPRFSEQRITAMTAAVLSDNGKGTLEAEVYDFRLYQAMLRQKIENTRLLPKFGFGAGYSLANTTFFNGNVAQQRALITQSVSIGGSWNIFDSFATRGAKREALLARRALEHRKTADMEELLQSIQGLDRSLRLDAEQLQLTDIRRGMAVEAQRRITTEVGFGNVPKGAIERARMATLLAEAKSLEARATFLGRWSEFVARASRDPALDNLPASYVRAKK